MLFFNEISSSSLLKLEAIDFFKDITIDHIYFIALKFTTLVAEGRHLNELSNSRAHCTYLGEKQITCYFLVSYILVSAILTFLSGYNFIETIFNNIL